MESIQNQRLTEKCGAKLYGREDELKTIRDAFHNISGSKKTVIISGASGVGKSKLTETAFENIDCLFGSGKFESKQRKPYAALMSALTDMCSRMATEQYTNAIKENLEDDDVAFLGKLVPAIQNLVGVGKAPPSTVRTSNMYTKEGAERLKYTLKLFFQVVSLPSRPTVLVLDDLQWMDAGSADVLRSLLSGTELKNFLFVGSYRDNDITGESPSVPSLLADMGDKAVTVHVENVDTGCINELLCDLLVVDDAQDLAEIMHSRTGGNMFHVLQLIDFLQAEGLLEYSLSTFSWGWNVNDIREKTMLSTNVVDMVCAKMNRLGDEGRACLKLCACLGFRFDESVLSVVKDCLPNDSVKDVNGSLRRLEDAGLIERLDTRGRRKFLHDKVHRAALILLENEIELMNVQYAIGTTLYKRFVGDESIEAIDIEDRTLFLIVDQLNPCREVINDEVVRIRLAELNRTAAKRAADLSAFIPAAFYLESGLKCMNRSTMWSEYYDLSLELYTLLAEMTLCFGDYERLDEAVEEVLRNSKSVDDRSRVNQARIGALLSKASYAEAVDVSLQMLDELGEKIPKEPNRFQAKRAVGRLKKRMDGISDEEILSLPTTTNERMALGILSDLVTMTFERRENLSIVCLCRMIELTMQYGLSPHSAVAFAQISMYFMRQRDMENACRFSFLTKEMLAKSQDQYYRTRALFFANMARQLREPYSHLLDSCMEGYRTGIKAGDGWFAFASVFAYAQMYYYSGLPLEPLAVDLEKYFGLSMEYRQKFNILTTAPLYQFVLNLLGKSDNILNLSQGVVAEYREKLGWENRNGERSEWAFTMQLSVYCGEWEIARKYHEKIKEQKDVTRGFFVDGIRSFFAALVAMEFSRRTKKRKWTTEAKSFIDDIRRMVAEKNINLTHKLQILQAEYMALEGKQSSDEIRAAYDKAIVASSKTGFLQDAGLAALLASRALPDMEGMYFERSCELYSSWGAVGLVEHLSNKSSRAFKPEHRSSSSGGFRGRPRLNSVLAKSHGQLDASENTFSLRKEPNL